MAQPVLSPAEKLLRDNALYLAVGAWPDILHTQVSEKLARPGQKVMVAVIPVER